jgi:hypothetical protein
MAARELISRVASYSWKGSFYQLADLAFLTANVPEGHRSEVVRRRTVDALLSLTGTPEASDLLHRCRAVATRNRDRIVLAHEEGISFLQHVVLLYGGEDGPIPVDSEIALWLAAVNDHLSYRDNRADLASDEQQLMANMLRYARFNNYPDVLRELVRSYLIFRDPPPHRPMEAIWQTLQSTAFPDIGFHDFFEAELGPLYILSTQLWGVPGSEYSAPKIDFRVFFSKTALSKDRVTSFLRTMSKSRTDLRDEIARELRQDGLPLAPFALRHSPFVEFDENVLVGASPGALLSQLRTGLWARYLSAAKQLDARSGATTWLSGFGYMVEYWCRRVALDAQNACASARVVLSKAAGSNDEVEDVVAMEGNVAILFSVKSRLMTEAIARGTASVENALGWLESFFFENKKDDHRGGAVRLVSSRIDKLRRGDFEVLGIDRSARVYPMIVTYDNFGLVDLHYQWLEKRSNAEGLLQQDGVGPLAVIRMEEFEDLLALLAQGKHVASLLGSRESMNQHRRLDQLIHEIGLRPERLPLFEKEMRALHQRIMDKLFGHRAGNR